MADPAAPLVSHGQLQLQIKASSSNNYDTQALGLLAVLVAVGTALVGVKDVVGSYWWTPLPTLLAATISCVVELYTGDFISGLPLRVAVTAYRGLTADQINNESVLDLIQTLEEADDLLRRKRLAVTLAVVFLAATATFLIVVLAV